MDKHQFALYLPDSLQVNKKEQFNITDKEIIHRIKNVLRLSEGDSVIFFNQSIHALGVIENIEKKGIRFLIKKLEKNQWLKPNIIILLPILKKEAFEEALYSCTELGASEVIPYSSAKTHRKHLSLKDYERAEKIMQMAAEQSKYYAFPKLSEVKQFNELEKSEGQKIFFDPMGEPVDVIIEQARGVNQLVLMVGPEGDLVYQEKEDLLKAGFNFCALTPTILRARQAVATGLGIFRSMLRD